MNTKFLKLRGLFSNTKFLIVFSIAVAFIFWIIVALQFSPIVDETIKDVPVSVDLDSAALSRYDLQCFGADNFKVDVTVEGKRYVVGVLKPEDFIVTASTSYVESSGTKTLILTAVPKDDNADYEVIRLSSETVEVYFDKLVKDVKVPIEARVISKPLKVTEDGLKFDEKNIIVTQQTATVSGAKSQIEKLSTVYADISIEKTMSVSTTVDATLSLGEGIDFVEIQSPEKNRNGECVVPAHLCVYKDEVIKTDVGFVNAPAGLKGINYKTNCNELNFSVLQSKDGVELPEKINVGEIDYRSISPSNNIFTFTAADIAGYLVQDNDVDNGIIYDGDYDSFTVELDTSALDSKKLSIPDSSLTFSDGGKAKYDYRISQLSGIEVVGQKSELSKLTSKNIVAVADMDGITVSKTPQKIPVTVTIKDNNTCWVYGEYYLTVSLK